VKYYTCEATGNTYQVKDFLKKLGFRFKSDSRSWMIEVLSEDEKKRMQENPLAKKVTFRFYSHETATWEK